MGSSFSRLPMGACPAIHTLIEGIQSFLIVPIGFTCGVILIAFGIRLHTSFVIHAYASSQPSEDVQ